jgi:hypothetical protein
MENQISLRELQKEAVAFRAGCESVILATSTPDAVPDASYAPAVLDDEQRCHLLVSQLAQHTKNLLAHPVASLLWIEDAETARNPFARRRLVLQCDALELERDSVDWNSMIDRMQKTHGNTVPLLASLGDFVMFRFEALQGNYVRGFAEAYAVNGNELAVAQRRSR